MKKAIWITVGAIAGVFVLLAIIGGILIAVGYKAPAASPAARTSAAPATSAPAARTHSATPVPARSTPARSAAWHVTRFIEITNPATITVSGFVANTGGTAATPACDISASDPGGAYIGFDTITAKQPIQPGHKLYFSDAVIITNQGARYVTSVKVTCHS